MSRDRDHHTSLTPATCLYQVRQNGRSSILELFRLYGLYLFVFSFHFIPLLLNALESHLLCLENSTLV
jgi:hypothetical protein